MKEGRKEAPLGQQAQGGQRLLKGYLGCTELAVRYGVKRLVKGLVHRVVRLC